MVYPVRATPHTRPTTPSMDAGAAHPFKALNTGVRALPSEMGGEHRARDQLVEADNEFPPGRRSGGPVLPNWRAAILPREESCGTNEVKGHFLEGSGVRRSFRPIEAAPSSEVPLDCNKETVTKGPGHGTSMSPSGATEAGWEALWEPRRSPRWWFPREGREEARWVVHKGDPLIL